MSEPSTALTRRSDRLDRVTGASASTAPVAFEGQVLTWVDLPTATRRVARRTDPVLAERVVVDDGLAETPTGVVQVVRAWRAHVGAIVVAVALRPVRVDGDVLRPAGKLTHVSVTSYDAATEPRRRVGTVASAAVVDGPAAPGVGRSEPHDAAAREAWRFLPDAVRRSAEAAAPLPEDWLGDLRQVADAGQPISQDIVVLRRTASAAAVVVASRRAPELVGATAGEVAERLAREPWVVEQLTYELRERPALGAGTNPARLPWA